MEKTEIFEMVIREMTESALMKRRETCKEEEQELYKEISALSQKRQEILTKVSAEERQVLEDYVAKTNLIADQECRYLYVQGAKDCVELLKRLGVL